MENKNYFWRPVSEYTGGRVLATNGMDVLIGEINSEGDCESEENGSTVLCGITGFKKIEEMLPELKESEDERIMNQLHSWMKEFGGAEEYTEKVYQWLKGLIEKQGEQNLANSAKTFKDEQKPAWSEEDEKMLQGIWDEIIANKHDAKEYEWKTYDKFLDWLNSIKERVLSHRKQEWSKEDEEKMVSIFLGIETFCPSIIYGNDKEELLIWFKSIKDRVQPQPKQEWSEEDGKMINKLLAVVNLYYDRSGNDLDKQSCISFLKSLKERCTWKPSEEDEEMFNRCIKTMKGAYYQDGKALRWLENRFKSSIPQNTWKPSDEQMKALKDALNDAICQYDFKGSLIKEEVTRKHVETIESLYNDLKKLKS